MEFAYGKTAKELRDEIRKGDKPDEAIIDNNIKKLASCIYNQVNTSTLHKNNGIQINKDIYSYIQTLKALNDYVLDKLDDDVFIMLEAELAGKKRADVILFSPSKVTVLEFKTGEGHVNTEKVPLKNVLKYLEQPVKYVARLNIYLSPIYTRVHDKNMTVGSYLVFTDLSKGNLVDYCEKQKSSLPKRNWETKEEKAIEKAKKFFVNSEKTLYKSDLEIVGTMMGEGDKAFNKELINAEFLISPDSAGMLFNILSPDVVPDMYTNVPAVKNCMDSIKDKVKSSNNQQYLNIFFVNGVPGGGKTAVGITLLREGYAAIQARDYEKRVSYITGNANLEYYFRTVIDCLSDSEDISSEDIMAFRKYINESKYSKRDDGYNQRKLSYITVFDEAQRAWDENKVAYENYKKAKKDNKNLSEKELQKLKDDYFEPFLKDRWSEPAMLIDQLLKDIHKNKKSRNLICLIGDGQEINNGEAGMKEWVRVLDNSSDSRICVYASEKVKEMFNREVISTELELTENQRAYGANKYLELVKAMLNLEYSDVFNRISTNVILNDQSTNKDKYKVIIIGPNELGKAHSISGCYDAYLSDMKNSFVNRNKTRGILSKASDNSAKDLGFKEFNDIDKHISFRYFKWYFEKESNELKSYVDEFSCQGLDIDFPFLIWGKKMLYKNGNWSYELNNDRNLDYMKNLIEMGGKIDRNTEELAKEYMRNAYRVLLTRGRLGMFIYVEDKETREYLKKCFKEYMLGE